MIKHIYEDGNEIKDLDEKEISFYKLCLQNAIDSYVIPKHLER